MAMVDCILCENRYNLKPFREYLEGETICYSCRNSPPPDEYRCVAITLKKTRCKAWRRTNKRTCSSHRNIKI